jgi:hypothetical protein
MKRSPSSPVHASRGAHDRTSGAISATSWLHERGLTAPTQQRWHVEIALDVVNTRAPSEFDDTIATRFHIDIYAEEWGVYVCHAGRSSWIRVTDIAFVHGRDDFQLLAITPPLRDIAQLLRHVEATFVIRLQRQHASLTTNLPGIEPAIRAWIATF